MNEFHRIVRYVKSSEEEFVLARVTNTEGRSFRKSGAMALFSKSGWVCGAVSGGCVESELEDICWEATEGGPTQKTFDTMSPDDLYLGYGSGCPGKIHVHLTRVCRTIPWMDSILSAAESRTLWTGKLEGAVGDTTKIEPPARLLVVGAGHDAIPLVKSAVAVGWDVVVADIRQSMLSQERFPGAKTSALNDYTKIGEWIDEWTWTVVMTHHFNNDVAILQGVLASRSPYVGLLSSSERGKNIVDQLGCHAEGRIDFPVGLLPHVHDPESMAVSILAQLHLRVAERG